jgi:type IV secretion system protein VirB6
MIQNALMVAGLRAAGARGHGAATAAGGVIRAGAGVSGAAAQAVGTAGSFGTRAAGGLASGAANAARQGYGAVRTAAYRLAALRGRT